MLDVVITEDYEAVVGIGKPLYECNNPPPPLPLSSKNVVSRLTLHLSHPPSLHKRLENIGLENQTKPMTNDLSFYVAEDSWESGKRVSPQLAMMALFRLTVRIKSLYLEYLLALLREFNLVIQLICEI